MIYANQGAKLVLLKNVMRSIGIPEDTITLMDNYLDTEQPRDDSILKTIVPMDLLTIAYSKRKEFQRAISSEIMAHGDMELKRRYVLFAHAVAGSTCEHILPSDTGLVRKVMQQEYRNKADAVMLSIYRANASDISKISKECYADALDFVSTLGTKVFYCSMILRKAKLPKQNGLLGKLIGEKSDPAVEKALQVLTEIYRSGEIRKGSDINLLYEAVAAASYFSKDMRKILMNDRNLYSPKEIVWHTCIFNVEPCRIMNALLDVMDKPDMDFIEIVVNSLRRIKIPMDLYETILKDIYLKFPEAYLQLMFQERHDNPQQMLHALRKYHLSSPQIEESLKIALQKRCGTSIPKLPDPIDGDFRYYLYKGGDITPFVQPLQAKYEENGYYYDLPVPYVDIFGMDAFARRLKCALLLCGRAPLFNRDDEPKVLVRIMEEEHVPVSAMLPAAAWHAPYNAKHDAYEGFAKAFKPYLPEIAALDVQSQSVDVRLFWMKVLYLSDQNAYREQLFSLAGDSSKKVRQYLAQILSEQKDWDVQELLTARLARAREVAVQAMESRGIGNDREALQEALAKEKNANLKNRMAVLLGEEMTEDVMPAGTDIVKELLKGGRSRKLAWLFAQPFAVMHDKEGKEIPEDFLKAFLLEYAESNTFGTAPHSAWFAEQLQPLELEAFALEVMDRWVGSGANAKQKWVLCFANLYGGEGVLQRTRRCVREWAEKSRGAIASEGVRAMAYNQSPLALVVLDDIARTFKKAQVKDAASRALQEAADRLGITTEELADRIVPDLGFDVHNCKVFDYGSRTFQVYLQPDMKLRVQADGKILKNLPKPGAKDDAEKAEPAYKAFSELKKQLKMVYKLQLQRLEYVLLCSRTWSRENWCQLMVDNAVMHPFSVGLVWGIYDDKGNLQETFRYLDDGSFSTMDGDELELPETAVIGLVHPLELTNEQLAAWKEQLEDFEVTQPFEQLERAVYKVEDKNRNADVLYTFSDIALPAVTLQSKMKKYGWTAGEIQDGGSFYEFRHTDIVRYAEGKKGEKLYFGNAAELKFSGMYIGDYSLDSVTTEGVQFYSLQSPQKPLHLGEVPPRYYSEIVRQLTLTLAGRTEETTEKEKNV